MNRVLEEIAVERGRQDKKFPDQHLPDGTGSPMFKRIADRSRRECDKAAAEGRCTWRDIAQEEVFESFAERPGPKLRAELVQAAAVLVRWIEDIDSRRI
jgi:hypothetical protein